jgi:hypothetical protein
MGQNARGLAVEQFSRDKLAQKVLELLKRTVDGSFK